VKNSSIGVWGGVVGEKGEGLKDLEGPRIRYVKGVVARLLVIEKKRRGEEGGGEKEGKRQKKGGWAEREEKGTRSHTPPEKSKIDHQKNVERNIFPDSTL